MRGDGMSAVDTSACSTGSFTKGGSEVGLRGSWARCQSRCSDYPSRLLRYTSCREAGIAERGMEDSSIPSDSRVYLNTQVITEEEAAWGFSEITQPRGEACPRPLCRLIFTSPPPG